MEINQSSVDDYFTSVILFSFQTQVLLSVGWEIDEQTFCLGMVADIISFFQTQPEPHAE